MLASQSKEEVSDKRWRQAGTDRAWAETGQDRTGGWDRTEHLFLLPSCTPGDLVLKSLLAFLPPSHVPPAFMA